MDKKTVYFRFRAGSEGAEQMKKLVEDIRVVETAADNLAKDMRLEAFYPDTTAEFGGIGLMEFSNDRAIPCEAYKVVGEREGRKLFQLDVESRDEVVKEQDLLDFLNRKDVMLSNQHYTWNEIKHRLTINAAANLCGYKLTGDKINDDRMITMQLGSLNFRIATFLTARNDKALGFYRAIHQLPILPLLSSNMYAGVSTSNRSPVYFFFNESGDFFCKALSESKYEHEVITEAEFNNIYQKQNLDK